MDGAEHPERANWTTFLEPEVFQALVNDYSRMVFTVCRRMLGNDAEAQDVTQECFEALARGNPAPRGVPAGAWLHGIATNRCRHHLRTEKRRIVRETAYAQERSPRSEPTLDDIYPFLDEALTELPDDLRVPIIASFFGGQSHRTIAHDMGVSRRTVSYRIARGIDQLALSLRKRGAVISVAVLASTLAAHSAQASTIPIALQTTLGKLALAYSVKAAASSAATTTSPWLILGGLAAMKKVLLAVTVTLLLAGGIYGGYRGWAWHRLPYKPRDITAASQFTVKAKSVKQTAPSSAPDVSEATGLTASPKVESKAAPTKADDVASVPAAYGIVYGIVLTEDGQPAPNARVSIENNADAGRLDAPPKQAIALAAVTDVNGRFQFDQIPLETSWATDKPNYVIVAEAGDQSMMMAFAGDQYQREWYFELILASTESLAGVVVDEAGTPVADAMLVMCGGMLDRPRNTSSGLSRTRSDSKGRFVFSHLFPGRYAFDVAAEGFVELLMTPWFRSGQNGVVIRLERGNAILGRITDALTGLPLTSYEVVASMGAPKTRDERAYGREGSGRIDSTGQFAITGLIPGKYALRLQGDSGEQCAYCLMGSPQADLTRTKTVAGLDLKAVKGGTIAGTVTDAQTGQAVPGANIKALGADSHPAGSGESDGTGAFRIDGLPAGAYLVKSKSRDYEERSLRIELEAGALRDGVVLRLSHLPGLRGRVVDADGRPVAGASVSGLATDDLSRQVSGISDASGAFGLYFDYNPPWVTQAPQAAYVQALAGTRISPRVGPVSLQNPGGEVVLALVAAGRIEGEVVDDSGNAVSDACIEAVSEDKSASIIMANRWGQSPRSDRDFCYSGLTGNFSFDALLPAKYELRVFLPTSPKDLPVATTSVSLGSGEVMEAHLVVNTSAFGRIEGRVTVRGEPAPSQRVKARSESYDWSQNSLATQTDEDGRYHLDSILAGNVSVVLTFEPPVEGGSLAQIVRTQAVEVSAGQTAVADFDIPFSAAFIEGVITTNGTPEFSGCVHFSQDDSSGEPQQADGFTDSQGYYKVGVLEGVYNLDVTRIRPEGTISTKHYATVQAVSDQTVRLDVTFGGSAIDGTLNGLGRGEKGYIALLPADTNVSQWTPQALQFLSGSIIRSTDVPGNGPFRLQDIEPGRYTLAAAGIPRDAPLAPATFLSAKFAFVAVEVRSEGTTTVEVTVQ